MRREVKKTVGRGLVEPVPAATGGEARRKQFPCFAGRGRGCLWLNGAPPEETRNVGQKSGYMRSKYTIGCDDDDDDNDEPQSMSLPRLGGRTERRIPLFGQCSRWALLFDGVPCRACLGTVLCYSTSLARSPRITPRHIRTGDSQSGVTANQPLGKSWGPCP